MLSKHDPYLAPKHFHHPKRKPHTVEQSLPSLSQDPWQPPICFLSPSICLFWVFRIKEIIPWVAFCVWPLSFAKFYKGKI